MAIGKLDIELAANIASFSQNMAKATGDIEKFTSSAKQVQNIAIGNFIADTARGAIEALVGAFSELIDQAQRFDDIAGRVGGQMATATGLQATALAMQSFGIAIGDTEKGLDRFVTVLQQLGEGKNNAAVRTFEALGVSMKTASGEAKPLQVVLEDTLQKLINLGPGTQQAVAAVTLFGKAAGSELAQALNTGELSIAKLQQAMADTAPAAAAFQELGNAAKELSTSLGFMATGPMGTLASILAEITRAASAVLPIFTDLVSTTGSLYAEFGQVTGAGDAAAATFGSLGSGAGGAAGFIIELAAEVASLISYLNSLIKAATAAAATLAALGQRMSAIAAQIQGFGTLARAGIDTALGRTGTDAQKFADDTKNAVESATKAMNDNAAAAADTLTNMGDTARQTGDAVRQAGNAAVKASRERQAEAVKEIRLNKELGAAMTGAGLGAKPAKAKKGGGGGGGKKGKSDAEKSVEELQKFVDKTREAEGSVASFAKALEENMTKTRQALEKGLITQEEADRFTAFFNKEYQLKVAKSTGIANMTSILDDLSKGFESFGKTAADSLADAIVEGKDLGDVMKSLVKDLAKMILKVAILEPLMNSLFGKGGIGGLFSGTGSLFSAPLSALPQAVVPATPLAFARGFAALPPTPTVYGVTRARVSPAASAAARTPVVQQNLGPMTINMTGTPAVQADTQQAKDLGVKIRASVQEVIATELRPGGILRSNRA